jgi:hypothetical protein
MRDLPRLVEADVCMQGYFLGSIEPRQRIRDTWNCVCGENLEVSDQNSIFKQKNNIPSFFEREWSFVL